VTQALEGVKCDVVVANPPYVPNNVLLPDLVSQSEPHEALYGGANGGLDLPRLFISAATRLLKPGGFLILEYFENQSALLERELSPHYSDISHYADFNQRPRWITARRKGE
jgi:release factor glutamine methyltransferase